MIASVSLGEKLRKVNAITSGWANYYRYCVGAGRVFVALDWPASVLLAT
ncbi:group II intron maturase-specific domain-containing protein [Sinorhizobium americanum]